MGSYHIAKIAALTVLAACAELPEIADTGCGNSVVEATEDCDTIAADGLTCAAPNAANACRYVCDSADADCPAGWGCGADGVCRVPSGVFEAPVASRFSAVSLTTGDVNGDGIGDLVGLLLNRGTVHYGGGSGETSFAFGLASGQLSVHDLDRDGFDDVIVPTVLGLYVARGSASLPLDPVTFAPIVIPGDTHVRFLPLDGDAGTRSYPGDEILAIVDGAVFFFSEKPPLDAVTVLPDAPGGGRYSAADLVGRIARYEPPTGPAHFALAFGGAATVYPYTVAAKTIGDTVYPVPLAGTPIALPAGYVVAAAGAGYEELDGEAGMDLGIAVEPLAGGLRRLAVAPNETGPAVFLDRFKGLTAVQAGFNATCGESEVPLAVSFQLPDYIVVGSNAVCLLRHVASCAGHDVCFESYVPQILALNTSGVPWTEATIADINGDLRKDVIAATGVFSFIDVFVAGPLKEQYNPFYLATVDPPTALRVGDYDGDYVADLAVIERGDFTGRDSSLSIMYGRTQGAPEPPISIGSFAPVIALEPTNIVKNAAFQLDTVTDLLVQFEGETEKGVAVLFGNSQRTLLSPYSLIPPEGGAEEQPLAAVTGDLDGDGLPDLFAVSALRGWFLRGTENGDLETVDAPLLAAGGLNQVRCTRWATGRFLGADADVIVGLDQSTVGRFCSPEIIDGIRPPPSLVFARVEAGELVTHSVVLPESFGSAVALEGADLDGDGLDELVIVMQSRDEPVRVLWDTAGEVGADQATVAPPLPGACPGCNASPLSLSVGNLDEDPQPEIAVLADTGVWVLEVDPETRALVWHDTPLLAPLNQPFADGDVRVVDLDGDGVLDVAVSQGTVVVSRRSVPLR